MPRRFVAAITINDLIEFLAMNVREEPSSKEWELHIAVVLAKFQSKQFGEEYRIALPIKERKRTEAVSAAAADDLHRIIKEFVDEDGAQDIYLTAESQIQNRDKSRPKGHGFQIKRIMHDPDKGELDDFIIDYLNVKIPGKYARAVNTSLLLVISSKTGKGGVFDVQKIKDNLTLTSFPFDHVLIAIPGRDEITFGELWPDFGAAYYTREQFDRLYDA